MKNLITLFFLLCSLSALQAQYTTPALVENQHQPKVHWAKTEAKKAIPAFSLAFIAGASWGMRDTTDLRYVVNNISLAASVSVATVYCTVPIVRPKAGRKWWHVPGRILIQSAALSAGYAAGNWLTFTKKFK